MATVMVLGCTVTVKDKYETVYQIGSRKPICRKGVTSLLSFSGMDSNAGGSACTGHPNPTIGLTSHYFLLLLTLRRNCSYREDVRLHQQQLNINKGFQITHNDGTGNRWALTIT
jgi:hypothetical protein